MANKRLLIYELNEVPRKIVIDFIKKRPSSTLAKIIKEGSFLETYASDQEELHPWSTWPTVHRGVNNNTHNMMRCRLPPMGPPLVQPGGRRAPIAALVEGLECPSRSKQACNCSSDDLVDSMHTTHSSVLSARTLWGHFVSSLYDHTNLVSFHSLSYFFLC